MKNKVLLFFLLVFTFTFLSTKEGISQTYQKKKTVLDLAHDRKIKEKEFTKTDLNLFNVKIYSVDKVAINKTHHWFLKLADLEGNPINYAEVDLDGYLKADPSIKFNYLDPLFKLCSEGKYIIGFVKVKNSGTWVLNTTIDNFGTKDTFTYEIEIGEVVPCN